MLHRRKHHLFMAAIGVALSAGAAAVASAVDATEKLVVTGALKVTHVFTEQVCDFDTLDQLEAYLDGVADRHNWFRHDQPAAAPLTDDAGQLAAPMSLDAIVGETTTGEQATANGLNPHYGGQFDGETAEQADARRAAAAATEAGPAADAAQDASAPATEGAVTATDSKAK